MMAMLGLSNIIMRSKAELTSASSIVMYSGFFLPSNWVEISLPLRTMSLSPCWMRQLFSPVHSPSLVSTRMSLARRYFCAEIQPIAVFFKYRSSLCPTSQSCTGKASYFSKSLPVLKLLQSLQILKYIIDMQEKVIRASLHAGSWYTSDKGKLLQELDTNLAKAKKRPEIAERKIKAMIGPHAGLRYSGPVAAWAYKYLQPGQNKLRVFLLGPSHKKYLEGVSFSICDELQTPIGNIEVDQQTINQLKTEIQERKFSKKDEEKQHSLEMHLPYLRQMLGDNLKIVPIIVGEVSPARAEELGSKLSKYFDDKDTVFVISSDFCHWGDNFDYQPHQKNVPVHEFISKMDHQGMEFIQKHDLKGFFNYLEKTENTICGRNPIIVLLSTILHSQLKLATNFVQYDQSSKVTSFEDSSVSYAASVTYQL